MAYSMLVTCQATQEHMVVEMPGRWDDDEFSWNEGHYSCDCNRALFFDGRECPCGETAYTARLLLETP